MKKKDSFAFREEKSRFKTSAAFALVTVLLLSSLLMVMLVGLLFLTSDEGERSSFHVDGERPRILIETVLQEVRAKIMDGGEIPYRKGVATASMTACPGLMEVRRYDVLPNRGYQVGSQAFSDEKSFFRNPFAREYEKEREGDWQPANPQWISLYSYKWHAPLCPYLTAEGPMGKKGPADISGENPDYNPQRVIDFNREDNPFRPGRHYLGGASGEALGVKNAPIQGEYAKRGREEKYRYRTGESAAERPVYVQWIPVYADSRYGAVRADGTPNPIVGRYAYWVDVENTKININTIKRDWAKTALGKLTGESDAERGRGSYFRQWEEESGDTLRYTVDAYRPTTYKLFPERVRGSYGLSFHYRASYGRADAPSKIPYITNAYEDLVFGWKDGMPPAIADTTTIDWKMFSALRPLGANAGVGDWLESALGKSFSESGYTFQEEVYGMLDPRVEKKNVQRGRLGKRGWEKMYGQAMTIYGWEEERDPLGRPKLDINAILREGDALFDGGKGLPQADHTGTPLQQFLARTEDPRYYAAYYPGAYPSENRIGKSYVDGLSAFAGRGVNAEKYGKAMRDQQVVNLIEYGRGAEEPPYIDRKRGIIGAKSMPYVAEVAIRARNALWDLWEEYDPTDYDPLPPQEEWSHKGPVYDPAFPGLNEQELVYNDDFAETKRLAMESTNQLYLAQRIYDVLIQQAVDKGRDVVVSGGDISEDGGEIGAAVHGGGGQLLPSPLEYKIGEVRFAQYLSHVLVDAAFALVNPNPLGRKAEKNDWKLRVAYTWKDPARGTWSSNYLNNNSVAGYGVGIENVNPRFFGANGNNPRLVSLDIRQHHCPYLLPGERRRVDHMGYFFDPQSGHHLVYFRPGTGMVPGVLVDGGPEREAATEVFDEEALFQAFRIEGWELSRRGQGEPHHVVPLRHPGQKAPPRKFWQLTVDRDGDGPEPPPNAGVLATINSDQGADQVFRYAAMHSLEHFRHPADFPISNLEERKQIRLPFGLGLEHVKGWGGEKGLNKRRNVAASWFSSQTIAEFSKFCESLMATIPPNVGESFSVKGKYNINNRDDNDKYRGVYTWDITVPTDPAYSYYVEQQLVTNGGAPFSALEGKLYLPIRALELLYEWITDDDGGGSFGNAQKARSDLLRFILLQVKLRDTAYHQREILAETGRSQASTGRSGEDDFVEGNALVERLVCIDPVLGHRTGNPDLRLTRDGLTGSGHFYGVNGHPWRRYHYYFYHYDKDENSPMGQTLGTLLESDSNEIDDPNLSTREIVAKRDARPEPDRCLTQYFNDPRRSNGVDEPRYSAGSVEKKVGNTDFKLEYAAYQPRKIPLHSLTGSVLHNAILNKEDTRPHLRGELDWAGVSDLEEEGTRVWPYGPGMNLNFTYTNERGQVVHDRFHFRNGSFLTHAPRGTLMTSIGEIGLCHSGFLQRAFDLDRPPLLTLPGVKRLGSPQYGPPPNMLLDLLTPGNFKDRKGDYLSRRDWAAGRYQPHSPENPRIGTWNINGKIAHDNYLAIREGAHEMLDNQTADFFARDLENVAAHPILVPSAVGKRRDSSVVIDGNIVLDPYLSPFVRFRRGWEHWLGMIAGDYSPNRNMGSGVWNKERGDRGRGDVYLIAQGTKNYSWHPGGARGSQEKSDAAPFIHFDPQNREKATLLTLGKAPQRDAEGNADWSGLGGAMSADGPKRNEKEGMYPLREGDNMSLYDVTRYGFFPLFHHISEVGYTGLGKIYTALNHKNGTTPAQEIFRYDRELMDEEEGGDGILGAFSQAGFARNMPWVMTGNQMSTSANVFTVHIITQSLRDAVGNSQYRDGEQQPSRREETTEYDFPGKSGIGYLDKEDKVTGEQWARVVVAKVARKNARGDILTDSQGTPQYDYRILAKEILENPL